MTNRQMFYTTESSVSSNRILYTPSIFAKSSCFYVQEIGSLVARKAHKSVRNNLDSYLFFFVQCVLLVPWAVFVQFELTLDVFAVLRCCIILAFAF